MPNVCGRLSWDQAHMDRWWPDRRQTMFSERDARVRAL